MEKNSNLLMSFGIKKCEIDLVVLFFGRAPIFANRNLPGFIGAITLCLLYHNKPNRLIGKNGGGLSACSWLIPTRSA